ncbi:TPA: argininosuccinate lyase, partial [Escherichia coli]|nr:argininosuccinate lyase [Escherichia coli]
HIVGSAVNYCIKHKKMLEELTMEEFSTFDNKIEKDIYESISLEACIKARMSYGGTGPDAVKKQIEIAKSLLK